VLALMTAHATLLGDVGVCQAALRALSNTFGREFDFPVDGPPQSREATINDIREYWTEKQRDDRFMALKRDPAVIEQHKRRIAERYRQSLMGEQ